MRSVKKNRYYPEILYTITFLKLQYPHTASILGWYNGKCVTNKKFALKYFTYLKDYSKILSDWTFRSTVTLCSTLVCFLVKLIDMIWRGAVLIFLCNSITTLLFLTFRLFPTISITLLQLIHNTNSKKEIRSIWH